MGCRYSPALPALLSDATPNRGLRVLCVFIVLIASFDAALAAGSMDEDDGDHDDHDTGDSRAGRAATTGTEAPQAPLCLTNRPTNRPNRTDKPTDGTELDTSNQRQRHSQQPEPTTAPNNNRQPASQPKNALELGLLSSPVREIRTGNSTGFVEVAPGGRSEISAPTNPNGRNFFLPFFLHDVVLPEEMLEPTSVPFSFDHGLPLNNNTEQTRSLPHRDKNIHTSASLDSPLSQRHSALPRKTKDCNREQNFVPGHTKTQHPFIT